MADRTSIEARREALADMYEALTRVRDAGGLHRLAGRDAAYTIVQGLTRMAMQAEDLQLADLLHAFTVEQNL